MSFSLLLNFKFTAPKSKDSLDKIRAVNETSVHVGIFQLPFPLSIQIIKIIVKVCSIVHICFHFPFFFLLFSVSFYLFFYRLCVLSVLVCFAHEMSADAVSANELSVCVRVCVCVCLCVSSTE